MKATTATRNTEELFTIYTCRQLPEQIIGVSLSEPHTSKLPGTSVIFTKIYEVVQIDGGICKH